MEDKTMNKKVLRKKGVNNTTLKEAQKIIQAYGIFWEYALKKLLPFFSGKVPEYFLPYPKKDIKEALNKIAEYHHNVGNQDRAKALGGAIDTLIIFEDNKSAIKNMMKNFNNKNFLDNMLSYFKKSIKNKR